MRYFTRSQLIKQLKANGCHILNRDISWACERGVVRPRKERENFYKYSEQDLLWLEKLSDLKRKGISITMLDKIIEAGVDNVYMFLDRMRS